MANIYCTCVCHGFSAPVTLNGSSPTTQRDNYTEFYQQALEMVAILNHYGEGQVERMADRTTLFTESRSKPIITSMGRKTEDIQIMTGIVRQKHRPPNIEIETILTTGENFRNVSCEHKFYMTLFDIRHLIRSELSSASCGKPVPFEYNKTHLLCHH